MKTLSLSLPCPSCEAPMRVSAVHCDSCEVTVQGRFQANEFSTLSEEELHFLRIFVFAEGRIRDMEGPLGLSYPTIRNRLSQLKEKLQNAAASVPASPGAPTEPSKAIGKESKTKPSPSSPGTAPAEPDHVLEQLDHGDIDFNQALRALQSLKKARRPNDK